ncbi:MAG: hypothetical protein R2843_08080 [Thermomicrobiales bacterium]
MALERAKRLVEAGRHVTILARLDQPVRPRVQPGRSAEWTNALGWYRSGGVIRPSDLRRRPEHRGWRKPGRSSLPVSSTPQPHGRRHLRRVQGHRQHGAHLERKLAGAAHSPAIDIQRSGTRREELCSESTIFARSGRCAMVSMLGGSEGTSRCSVALEDRSNAEFLATLSKDL